MMLQPETRGLLSGKLRDIGAYFEPFTSLLMVAFVVVTVASLFTLPDPPGTLGVTSGEVSVSWLTSVFLHNPFPVLRSHLITNLIGLFIFGNATEKVIKGKYYLVIFLFISGTSNVLSRMFFSSKGVVEPVMGASGGIYAIAAFLSLYYLYSGNIQLARFLEDFEGQSWKTKGGYLDDFVHNFFLVFRGDRVVWGVSLIVVLDGIIRGSLQFFEVIPIGDVGHFSHLMGVIFGILLMTYIHLGLEDVLRIRLTKNV